ncbi:hypothetical protein [Hydrotalea sandarakina]|jgi:hypothetical protein|nr:hypothetical protein [Hydrotalea sandarakina]
MHYKLLYFLFILAFAYMQNPAYGAGAMKGKHIAFKAKKQLCYEMNIGASWKNESKTNSNAFLYSINDASILEDDECFDTFTVFEKPAYQFPALVVPTSFNCLNTFNFFNAHFALKALYHNTILVRISTFRI